MDFVLVFEEDKKDVDIEIPKVKAIFYANQIYVLIYFVNWISLQTLYLFNGYMYYKDTLIKYSGFWYLLKSTLALSSFWLIPKCHNLHVCTLSISHFRSWRVQSWVWQQQHRHSSKFRFYRQIICTYVLLYVLFKLLILISWKFTNQN